MDMICTMKKVAQSGGSLSVNISKECKKLGIRKGDWALIKIEPIKHNLEVCSCDGCTNAPTVMVSFDGEHELPMCRVCALDKIDRIYSFRKIEGGVSE